MERNKHLGLGFYHLLGGALTLPNNVGQVKIDVDGGQLMLKYGFKSETYPLRHITASVETQEQITRRVTATRLLAIGIFAFAAKKKEAELQQFLHISSDEPNRVANIVFDTDKAPQLANYINAAASAEKAELAAH